MDLKMLSAKWRQFCLGLSVLKNPITTMLKERAYSCVKMYCHDNDHHSNVHYQVS